MTSPTTPTLCAAALSLSALLMPGIALAQPKLTLVTEEAGISGGFFPAPGYPGENASFAGGASVGDFNRDGWPDIYMPTGGLSPERLYINQQDGTFKDEAAAWGVDRLIRATGSAVGDFNNDGWPDLYVVNLGSLPGGPAVGACLLYKNLGPDESGQFRFEEIGVSAGVNKIFDVVGGTGAAFGDVDLDGDLDLFTCAWDFFDNGNRLWINNGDETFTDASDRLPVPPDPRRGFTPNFADLDGDRLPEILMTNDFHTSALYKNTGVDSEGLPTFLDITEIAGITEDYNGMGSTLADFDGDSRMDWFMTCIHLDPNVIDRGNALYFANPVEGIGLPTFEDLALPRGVRNAGWGWGCTAIDLDNDTDQDLPVVSGWPPWPNEPWRIYMNDGTGTFSEEAAGAGFSKLEQGRGLVHLDYDQDGRADLLVIVNGALPELYRNETPSGSFLRIDLDSSRNPCIAPDGFGARITVTANGTDQVQLVDSRTTFLGVSEPTRHFGVGDAAVIDRVEVSWVDGTTTVLEDIAPDQTITIESFSKPDLDRSGTLNFFDLGTLLVAYNAGGNGADFDGSGTVEPADVFAFIDAFLNPCGD